MSFGEPLHSELPAVAGFSASNLLRTLACSKLEMGPFRGAVQAMQANAARLSRHESLKARS